MNGVRHLVGLTFEEQITKTQYSLRGELANLDCRHFVCIPKRENIKCCWI